MNVAETIKKLLALAQSSNPNEAALAAAKAQELMVKYAIEEAAVAGTPGAVAPEPVQAEKMGAGGKTVSHWQLGLADAMARSFFCRVYYTAGTDIFMVGRRSDREAFRATWFYLRDEIDRMAAGAWEQKRAGYRWLTGAALAGQSVRWKRGFYHGAVETVRERLDSSLKKLSADNTGTAIVLANRQKDVDLFIDAMKLRKGRGARVNSSGFGAGKQAGWTLNLDKRAGASRRLAG